MNCTAHGRAWCFERPCMEERRRATVFEESTQIHGATTLGFAEPSVFEASSPSVFDAPAPSDCGPSDSPTSDSGASGADCGPISQNGSANSTNNCKPSAERVTE